MKVTLSITAILFITLTGLYQQPKLHYVENSLLKAKKESIRQNKPLFIKAYASWCGACRKLNNTTLADKEVITTLNKHYICYQIDMETEEGRSFAKKYNIRGYPTLLIFGPDGVTQCKTIGYTSAADLLLKLNTVLEAMPHE